MPFAFSVKTLNTTYKVFTSSKFVHATGKKTACQEKTQALTPKEEEVQVSKEVDLCRQVLATAHPGQDCSCGNTACQLLCVFKHDLSSRIAVLGRGSVVRVASL